MLYLQRAQGLAAVLSFLIFIAMPVFGQIAGDLDRTFGPGGIARTSLSPGIDRANAVARQTDGKIVAAGVKNNGQSMALVRYNLNGTLDTSFDGDGIATVFNGNIGNEIFAVAIQVDGKIVAAGTSFASGNSVYTVVRLNADGSPDNSFSGDGIYTADGFGSPYAVAIQSDGKIVTAGVVTTNFFFLDFTAVRLNSDGTPDNSFDGDGRSVVSFGQEAQMSTAYGVAIQADGKIVMAGEANSAFGLIRLNTNGSPDTSFDGDGKLRTQFTPGQNAFARAVAIAPNGSIVAAGYGSENTAAGFAVARYLSDGTLDTTFSGDGKTVTPDTNIANAVAVQTDGKIVAAGYSSLSLAVARYRVDGALDTSFAGDGLIQRRVDGNGYAIARGVAVGPDGNIAVAGNASSGGGPEDDFFIARFAANGAPAAELGVSGCVVTNPFNEAGQSSYATATIVQADGKILVAGNRAIDDDRTVGSIIRYTDEGLLDSGFASSTSGGGIATISVPGASSQEVTSITVQPDGKIVAVGSYDQIEDFGTFAVRLNTDGTRDLTFGGNGTGFATFNSENGGGLGQDVVLQPDGKIVIGGASFDFNGQTAELTAIRLNSNGAKDVSFGNAGVAVVDLGAGNGVAFSIARQANGKIVLGGASNFSEKPVADTAVVRLNADGTPDGTFASGGKYVASLSPAVDMVADVAIQADGKAVVGLTRCTDTNCTSAEGVLLRMADNGTLDASFSGDGMAVIPAPSVVNSIVIQSNGKILVGGNTFSTNSDGLIVRLMQDGSLDPLFGTGGVRINNEPNMEQSIAALAIATDGKIIATGGTVVGQRDDIVVWRHLGDVPVSRHVLFDYDGDGKADLSVRRPTDNVWYLLRGTAGYTAMQFGEAGDRIAPADYDGDGKTDVAVFRPSTGTWFVFASQTQTFQQFGWGANGDLPVPTDRDNDGKADLVVYRESNNTWYTRFANGTFATTQFGVAGDKPLVGDFDGDGIGDIALFRPSNNNWYLIKSSLGFFIQTWGESGDIPVPADYDGDGATDQAVFRPSTGQWFLSRTTAGFGSQSWGQAGDIPVAADYDGDGKSDVAVFRPSNGNWYIVNSTAGQLIQQFGTTGDLPTQSAFIY